MGGLIAGLLGGGGLLSFLGGRRTNAAGNREVDLANTRNTAEDTRLEAEHLARAQGRAALMRGVLNAQGFGGSMTDEQILAMLTGTRRRTPLMSRTPGQSIFSTLGGMAGSAGNALAMGSSGSPTAATGAAQAASSADWSRFLEELMANQGRGGIQVPTLQ